jgi:hypothetical protein
MKKFLFLCTAIAVSTTVFSQQARFGIKGGVNLANQKIKASIPGMGSGSENGDGIVSFHIGGVAEIPFSPRFSFRPELLLSGKGTDLDGNLNGTPGTAKFRPFYIEVPLNVVFTHDFPDGIHFYAGAGPSVGFGVFGKAKYENLSDDVFQDSGFKRLDFGINLLAGIELNSGVTFGVNFTPGLANIYGQDLEGIDVNWTNRVFAFSVGYMLKRRRQ